jgi:hypothetical protein
MDADGEQTGYVGSGPHFSVIFMAKNSTYRPRNDRTNLSALTLLRRSLIKEFRELQDLRQRVRKAEAAAAERLIRPCGKAQQKDYERLKAERLARAAKSEDKK